MKNFTRTNNLLLVIALILGVSYNSNGQSGSGFWGNGKDILVTNMDKTSGAGQLRLQTLNTAFTLSNFTDRFAISQVNGTDFKQYGREVFSVDVNGLTSMDDAIVGDLGWHWAGFMHKSLLDDKYNSYVLKTNSAGTYTYLNKKDTGDGYISFRIGDQSKMVVANNGNVGIGTVAPEVNLEINSGNDGNAILRIEADEDNNNEADNPMIQLRQDSGITGINIGFSEDEFGENMFGIGTRWGNIEQWDALLIHPQTANVGIGNNLNVQKDLIVHNNLEVQNNLNIQGDTNITGNALVDKKIIIGASELSSQTDESNTILTVSGGIKTDKVILNIGSFPDYVFDKEYPLMPIQEVAKYVAENKHLPNIPSEKEVVATGLDLRMISVKLVEKIEELTLYAIQQDEKLTVQDDSIIALRNYTDKQEEKLSAQERLISVLIERLDRIENKVTK